MPDPHELSTIHCPQCGHAVLLETLLSQVENHRAISRFADGSEESEQSALNQHCPNCAAHFTLPVKQVASLILKVQTEELFASISRALRGKATLQ